MLRIFSSLNIVKPRPILLCPGPVMLSKKVLRSVGRINIGHRELEFSNILLQSVTMLLPIIGLSKQDKDYEVAFITGSGTATNEMVLSSIGVLGPVLVVSNGEFGERLFEVANLHNKKVDHLQFAWQEEIDLDRLKVMLQTKKYHMVAVVHHETSTGMLNPIRGIATIAHEFGALISVDAISSIGAEYINVKKWGIDVLVGASGKALSAMPGVGILVIRAAIARQLDNNPATAYYLDIRKHLLFMRNHAQTPNTPAIHVFVSLHASLEEITEMGLIKYRQSISSRALLTRYRIKEMGLTYSNYGAHNSNVITCVNLPEGADFEGLKVYLKSKGIVIYGCKGLLKDRLFQIGHIGALRKKDTDFALNQIKIYLTC